MLTVRDLVARGLLRRVRKVRATQGGSLSKGELGAT